MTSWGARSAKVFLLERWRGQESRLAAITLALEENRDWTEYLLANSEVGWLQLPGVESCGRSTLPGEKGPRDLRGVRLTDLNLEKSTRLADTSLDYCVLDAVLLNEASLRGSSLRGAEIRNQASLEGAMLTFCDLREANFTATWMPRADLSNADICGTDFRGATLTGALFKAVTFSEEGIFGGIWRGRKWTRFGGEMQETDELADGSDRDLVQHMNDEVVKAALRERHPTLAQIAYLLTNYGSSPGRLGCWVFGVWLFFGLLYNSQWAQRALPCGFSTEVLSWISPSLIDSTSRQVVLSPTRLMYFSVITLTTVGFGDVTPAPDDWKGQLYVSLEALSGYVLLGAFVSLLLRGVLSLRE